MKRMFAQTESSSQARHGGAAMIVVIAMTGMLAFLGFFFFSFVASERNSAAWFTLAANREVVEGDYFDFALQQVIVGPPDDFRNSALFGRKWSILPNAVGSFGPDLKPNDLHLFSGRGVTVSYQSGGDGNPSDNNPLNNTFTFDYNGDGIGESRVLNFSPAANPVGGNNFPFSPLGAPSTHPNAIADFEPDAGYTYPDINSMFLGHFSLVDVDPSAGGTDLRRLWIPSFHRPQYLPRNQGATVGTDIYADSTYANMVLRPHQQHYVLLKRFDSGTGSAVFASRNRFVPAGGFDATYTNVIGPTNGFPFPDFGADEYHAGIWTHGVGGHTGINYDVDADGLSINGNEAILMDLDHGVEITADGTRRIPIYAITIVDGDGLINLNTAGNLLGEYNSVDHIRSEPSDPTDDPFGDFHSVTLSNLGLSPGEVNPVRAFYRPLPTAAANPNARTIPPDPLLYDEMFNIGARPGGQPQVTQLDMANMELARLLIGVADRDSGTVDERVMGRWGNIELLEAALSAGDAPAPARPRTSWGSPNYPLPGVSERDDDNDWLTGGGKVRFADTNFEDEVFGPMGINVPSGVHPFDEIGAAVDFLPRLPAFTAAQQYSISWHTRRPNANELFLPNDAVNSNINSPTPQEYGTFRFASQPFAGAGPSHNPSKWPLYSGKWELQVSDRSRNVSAANGNNYEEHELMRTTTGVIAWCQTYSQYADFENDPTTTTYGVLQSKNHAGQENLYLVDEPGEINVEPAFRNNASDGLFSIAETQFLHFSDGDWGRVKATFSSRLQKLVEYNFDRDTDPYDLGGTAYDDGAVLRSQFTTESWDRWEFSFAPALGADFSDVTTHDDGGYGSTNYSQTRGWEFNPVNNDVTRLAFPPEFVGAKRYTVNDPFRPETRQWLTVELNRDVTYSNFALPQQKLNLNRLLDKDPTGQFRQRQLTPHPVFENGLDSDDNNILNLMYGTGTSVVKLYGNGNPLPAQVFFEKMQNDKFVQEWWAKYDRQRLARDIYCLLYVLGNGNDRADPTYQNTGSSNRNDPYPVIVGETDNEDTDLDGNPDGDGVNDNLQAMAQFAVNYVDALDRDSVITEFVYDTDLSDGWDIDGAKVTSSGDFQDTSGETRSVFGVEMQQLTFSETFWVNIQSEPMDSMKTRWDDNSAIQFLFMELRNACPFDVSTINNTWRIRRIIGNDDGDPTVSESDDPTITFTRTEGADTFQDDVRPGALFRVQLHNGGAGHDAHLYLDADGSMTIEPGELICPSFNEGSLDDRNYIDLNKPGHNSEFSGNAANFFAAIPNDKFEIVLERRANMQGDSLLNNSREDVNPWVRVDYMQCVRDGDVDLLDDTTGDFRSDAFQDHYSIERREPFARFPRSNGTDTNEHTGSSVAPYRNHSMGPETPAADDHPYVEKNSNCPEVNSTATFTLWQPHFDRDFTSVFDLLSIPIVGPDQLTEKLAEGGQMSGKNTAFTKFAIPDPGTRNSANGDNEKVDNNRWYRLLGLVEIPTGAQQVLRDSLINLRTPGKINLNTIRHPGVLAALIDDDFHLDTFRQPRDVVVDSDAVKATYAWLQLREPVELPNGATISREPNRHWYEQFMFSRDRRDPYTGLTLPGIPGSRPFRPFHYTNIYSGADANLYRDSVASVEHTMLRSLPIFNGAGLGENLDAQGVPGLDSGSGWGTRTVTDANIETGIDEAVQRRRLFEARTSRDQGGVFPGGSPVNAVDFHTRHRLLSKISNNSTIRSNVFYCWIHVQFHEAAEDDFGNVQIGGQLNPSTHPAQRAFFIIDRSKMEEAWDPRTQTFDWRKMVTFSQILD